MKNNLVGFLKVQLVNIYDYCSDACLKKFDNDTLADREKICLSRCFERKSESFNMTTQLVHSVQDKKNGGSGPSETKVIDGVEVRYEWYIGCFINLCLSLFLYLPNLDFYESKSVTDIQ